MNSASKGSRELWTFTRRSSGDVGGGDEVILTVLVVVVVFVAARFSVQPLSREGEFGQRQHRRAGRVVERLAGVAGVAGRHPEQKKRELKSFLQCEKGRVKDHRKRMHGSVVCNETKDQSRSHIHPKLTHLLCQCHPVRFNAAFEIICIPRTFLRQPFLIFREIGCCTFNFPYYVLTW